MYCEKSSIIFEEAMSTNCFPHRRRMIKMKIKWIGKYDGNNLPKVEMEVDAKTLPEVTTKSAVILLPILLIFAFCESVPNIV